MRRRAKRDARGFTLLVVVVMAALLAMISGTFIRVVQSDLVMVGQARRLFEAREIAEGAVAQALNDTSFLGSYPGLDNAQMSVPYPPASLTGGPFLQMSDRTAVASVRLLRMGPPLESSLEQTRTLTYEMYGRGGVSNDTTQSEVYAEVIRFIGYPKGWAPEVRHYR